MDNQNGETVGGFVQSFDPEVYKLTPVADWVVEAVPGETPEDASPLLYSEDLADESIRVTLAAMGDAGISSSDGIFRAYDLSKIDPGDFDKAFDGAEALRRNPNLPPEIKIPIKHFFKSIRSWLEAPEADAAEASIPSPSPVKEEKPAVDARQAALAKHEQEVAMDISLTKDYCEERGTDKAIGSVLELTSQLEPRFTKTGKLKEVDGSEEFEQTVERMVIEFASDPEALVDFLVTLQDMRARLREEDSSQLFGYLNKVLSDVTYKFNYITYPPEEFTVEQISKWMSLYVSHDFRVYKDPSDWTVQSDDPESRSKAVFWATQIGAAMQSNTLGKIAEESKRPEDFIDSLYNFVVAGADPYWSNKTEHVKLVLQKTLPQLRIAGEYLRCSPLLEADEETRNKATDLWYTLQDIGVSADIIGFSDPEERQSLKAKDRIRLSSVLPFYRTYFDRSIPKDMRDEAVTAAQRQVLRTHAMFVIGAYGDKANAKDTILIGKLRKDPNEIVTHLLSKLPQDA